MRKRYNVQEPEEFYFPLRGGMDLITPPYQIQPGKMLDCMRYEVAASGGYKPMDGYERVDGNGVPSQAVYQFIEFTDSEVAIAVGTTVTGLTSGAVGISIASGEIDFEDTGELEDITGSGAFLIRGDGVTLFEDGEDVQVASVTVATVATAYLKNIEITDAHEAYYRWKAVEMLRSLVQEVPGSGPIRGVWRFDGDLYAFRDNAAGTECVMHREDSTAGWAVVTTPTLNPGGSYRFINTNFGGSSSTIMMYGCDGENKAFQFDGTTFTQITTGMTVDTPYLITEHAKHLFLGFTGGSLQHSPPTDPTGTWSVVVDAGELGMGEELSDVVSLPGGVLGIWCKDSTHLLYGTGVGTWELDSHSKESGGISGTVQSLGRIVFLNNTGLADFSATNAYGSFKSGTISEAIQPLLDQLKSIAAVSVAIPSKNQYRIFFENGYAITATFKGTKPQFSLSFYPLPVRCISSPKRADDELGNVYFGSDDGYVYKMDSGVSMDDKPMEAFVRLPYSHQGAARRKKRYREIIVELESGSTDLHLSFAPDFSFSRSDIQPHNIVNIDQNTGQAGWWDVSDWDEFSWESTDGVAGGGGIASGRLDGVATEMGLMLYFYAPRTTTPLHTLNGIFIYFNYRGRQR